MYVFRLVSAHLLAIINIRIYYINIMRTITSTEIILLAVLAVWELAWKGFALWRAGQRKDKELFIVLLVLNTAGIFPIVYLYLTRKQKSKWPLLLGTPNNLVYLEFVGKLIQDRNIGESDQYQEETTEK